MGTTCSRRLSVPPGRAANDRKGTSRKEANYRRRRYVAKSCKANTLQASPFDKPKWGQQGVSRPPFPNGAGFGPETPHWDGSSVVSRSPTFISDRAPRGLIPQERSQEAGRGRGVRCNAMHSRLVVDAGFAQFMPAEGSDILPPRCKV